MKGLIRSTMPPKNSITVHYSAPEAIKNCYTVMLFAGRIFTTVTKNPDVATEWIANLKRYPDIFPLVGFEFEFDFKNARVGTLQLCSATRCLIFQLDKRSRLLPACLDRFLGDHNYTFVGTQMDSKLVLLRSQFYFAASVQGVKLEDVGGFLKDKKKRELGKMELGKVESSWDRLPNKLSHQQVHYATLDAYLNWHLFFTSLDKI